ncbi:MAG: hypothetical protein AAFY26_00650 [Cyanobacteria bacterium J06638_22]
MHRFLPIAFIVAMLPACERVSLLSASAVEQRRTANDMQARLTMAATCDIAIGSYFRELNATERQYAGLVCGGEQPTEGELRLPARLGIDSEGKVRLLPVLP